MKTGNIGKSKKKSPMGRYGGAGQSRRRTMGIGATKTLAHCQPSLGSRWIRKRCFVDRECASHRQSRATRLNDVPYRCGP